MATTRSQGQPPEASAAAASRALSAPDLGLEMSSSSSSSSPSPRLFCQFQHHDRAMASSASISSTTKNALIVCDVQPDALSALSASARATLLQNLQIALQVIRQAQDWTVILVGLRFPPGYANVSPHHKLYGALRRTHELLGSDRAHWFVEGYEGSEMDESVMATLSSLSSCSVRILWRSSHLPPSELMTELESQGISKATVVGLQASYAVHATVQAVCDLGLSVRVVSECVADADPQRLEAVMKHLVPIYAHVISLANLVDEVMGLAEYEKMVAGASSSSVYCSDDSKETETTNDNRQSRVDNDAKKLFSLCDCGRGGHMALYASHLLHRSSSNNNITWCRHPLQPWYTDNATGREYQCPLCKRVVDFCDEPQFSRIAMYIRGREWLDEKDKILELLMMTVDDDSISMPKTFVWKTGAWIGNVPSHDDDNDHRDDGPWFVKECDKNGGHSVIVCRTLAECSDLVQNSNASYVVQAHVDDPLLTDKGQKCHIKLYCLLHCAEDGTSWTLYIYQDAYLCVSPNRWTRQDLSLETQVTTLRHRRMRVGETVEEWTGWPAAYNSCRDAVVTLVDKALQQDKLSGRRSKTQFEIFSVDFMLDTSGMAWLIECNFSPVLFDPLAGQELTTAGLREYQRLYDVDRESAEVNDQPMISEAVSLIFFPEEKQSTRWDLTARLTGSVPKTIDANGSSVSTRAILSMV